MNEAVDFVRGQINPMLLHMVGGALVLLFGRKLFWLFVGVSGFLAGIQIAAHFFRGQPPLMHWLTALVLGICGVLLALFVQKAAIAISGFLCGGFLAASIAASAHISLQPAWLIFALGGIVGAVLLFVMFDWALILLSSLLGSLLLAQTLTLSTAMIALCFTGMLVLGIMVQARMMQTDRREGRK